MHVMLSRMLRRSDGLPRVTSAGNAVGIAFRFDRIERQQKHVRRS